MFPLMIWGFKGPLAFSGWAARRVDEGEVPAALSRDRDSGRAKQVPLLHGAVQPGPAGNAHGAACHRVDGLQV